MSAVTDESRARPDDGAAGLLKPIPAGSGSCCRSDSQARGAGVRSRDGVQASARAHSESPGAGETESHIENVSKLRQKMREHLRRSVSDADVRLGTAAHADKVKQRSLYLENLTKGMTDRIAKAHSFHITLRRCIGDIQRRSGAIKASLGICDQRRELRAGRPSQELFQDSFDVALVLEREIYVAVQGILCRQLQDGQELVKPLSEVKKEMQTARLALQFDRSGYTERLVLRATELLSSAERYCKDSQILLQEIQEQAQSASQTTCARMKEQITETFNLRGKIESEMEQTRATISQAEAHLTKTEKLLKISLAMPERNLDLGGDGKNEELSAKRGVLAELRAKIKSAAYTGPGGRNWEVTFSRFDKDHSGELDEDEVRMAIRKACKIPPSVITDVDISALCELLDEDASGRISVAELVDFLLADVDVEHLQEEVRATRITLDSLNDAQEKSLADLRTKIAVWRINDACAKMTPIKGLKLDRSPTMCRPKKAAGCNSGVGSKVRNVLRDAVACGKLQAAVAEARAVDMNKITHSKVDGQCVSAMHEELVISHSANKTANDTWLQEGDSNSETPRRYWPSRGADPPGLDRRSKSSASRRTCSSSRPTNSMMSEDERCLLRSKMKEKQVRKLLTQVMHQGSMSANSGMVFHTAPSPRQRGPPNRTRYHNERRQNVIESLLNPLGDQSRSVELSSYLDESLQKQHRRHNFEVDESDQRRKHFVEVLMQDDDTLRKHLQQALNSGPI